MAKLSVNTSNIPALPGGLKDLNQFGRETFDIVGEDKFFGITLGGSAADFWPHFENALFVVNGFREGKNYELVSIEQNDKPIPNSYYHGQPIDYYREVKQPTIQINPIGCYRAIVFDNSSRTYKSLNGFWKWFLPIANKLSMEEVAAFVIEDEYGGTNSTAIPEYKKVRDKKTGEFRTYKGPLGALKETAESIYDELDNDGLTRLVSRYVSPTHLEAGFRKKLEEIANETVNKVLYPSPRHQKILAEGIREAYE